MYSQKVQTRWHMHKVYVFLAHSELMRFSHGKYFFFPSIRAVVLPLFIFEIHHWIWQHLNIIHSFVFWQNCVCSTIGFPRASWQKKGWFKIVYVCVIMSTFPWGEVITQKLWAQIGIFCEDGYWWMTSKTVFFSNEG